MNIDKFKKILEKKEDWFKNNPENGIDWINKKKIFIKSEKQNYDICFKLLSLNEEYIKLFPKISKEAFLAAEAVLEYTKLYDLFPQFHENLEFCKRLITFYYSKFDNNGNRIKPISNEYRPKFYKFIPESVAKNPEFLLELFLFENDNSLKTPESALAYFSELHPDIAEKTIKEYIYKKFLGRFEVPVKNYRETLDVGNPELADKIFSHEFCNSLKKIVGDKTKKEVEDVHNYNVFVLTDKEKLEWINKIEKRYNEQINNINDVDSESIKMKKAKDEKLNKKEQNMSDEHEIE